MALVLGQPGTDTSSGGPVAGALEASAVLLGGITATGVD